MINEKSSLRWANEITVIMNAAYETDRFPIKISELAKNYSTQLYPDDPITLVNGRNLPGFDGALYPAPDGKKGWGIIYNSSITSVGRINFTLAHEFGHYLQHRQKYPNGISCGQQDIVRWDSEYGQIEHQANQFAAALLMPLDDFRRQISAKQSIDMDAISHCADRYEVSLIAAILRWLSYTEKRAVLVVSREGFILWARSSDPALKTGAFFRTSVQPIEIPEFSLAAQKCLSSNNKAVEIPAGTWFDEEGIHETVLASERYDFTASLLILPDNVDRYFAQEELGEESDSALEASWTPRFSK